MPPDKNDAAYLWDMMDAARAILEFTAGSRYSDYLADRKTRVAVEREVEIVGEAARNVSRGFQNAHPEIPWRKIVAQRHVLAHEYGEIRQDIMWVVVTVHIPELIRALEPLVSFPPSEPQPHEPGDGP
jgi:uncharacterized protein with HEPN domain